MTIQKFCRLFNVLPFAFLVVEKTEFECCFSLCLLITFLESDVEYFKQMLNSRTDIAALRMCLCKLLVSLSCGTLVSIFDAKVQEVLPVLDRLIQVTLVFIDHTDLLVALSFLLFIISSS